MGKLVAGYLCSVSILIWFKHTYIHDIMFAHTLTHTVHDCTRLAVHDRPFTLHCHTNCSVQADQVTWCFTNGDFTRSSEWSVCFNSSGMTTVYNEGSIPDDVQIDNVMVTESGDLYLPMVHYDTLGNSNFNCSVTGEPGIECGGENFVLYVDLSGECKLSSVAIIIR